MRTTRNRAFGIGAAALAALLGATGTIAGDAEDTTVDASTGGFSVKSGDNSLNFGGYAQLRATMDDREAFDADTTGSGVGIEDGASTSFEVKRARLEFDGTMFRPWLQYKITYELAQTSGDRDSKFKDVYLAFAKNPAATLQVGQYKVPFSMQELTSDTRQQFVDRGITNTFAPARDAGITLTGLVADGKFGYAVGAFNGAGESKGQDDQGLMVVGRIWVDPLGKYRLSEGTVDAKDAHELHFGAAFRTGEADKGPSVAGVFEDPNDERALQFEAAWRFSRLFATFEYFMETAEFTNPVVGPDVDRNGWHLQGAVMAIPEKLEFGVRYAVVDGNEDVPGSELTESRLGANWYLKKHNLKVQFDVGQVEYEPNAPGRGTRLASATGLDVKDKQARLQVQLAF